MRLSSFRLARALAVTTAVVAAPLSAQRAPASSTRGFFAGIHLNGSSVKFDGDGDEETESGPGLGFQLGYGFTRKVALYFDGTGAALEGDGGNDVGLAHGEIGVRYAFTGPTRRFVPFLEAGIAGMALVEDDAELETGSTGDVSLSGAGFTLGGGVQYYVSPKFALGAGLKFTSGEFTTFKVDNLSVGGFDTDATTTRINLGFVWYPMAGR
jgi:opacity protein-like surface antigen